MLEMSDLSVEDYNIPSVGMSWVFFLMVGPVACREGGREGQSPQGARLRGGAKIPNIYREIFLNIKY